MKEVATNEIRIPYRLTVSEGSSLRCTEAELNYKLFASDGRTRQHSARMVAYCGHVHSSRDLHSSIRRGNDLDEIETVSTNVWKGYALYDNKQAWTKPFGCDKQRFGQKLDF